MAKGKYTFNVGDEVVWDCRIHGVPSGAEKRKVARVKGRWFWLEGDDADWNCFDRNTGEAKEAPIPGIVPFVKAKEGA